MGRSLESESPRSFMRLTGGKTYPKANLTAVLCEQVGSW